MTRCLLVTTFSAIAIAAAPAASLVNYWDFDALTAGAPDDLAGGVPTSNVSNGGTAPDISVHASYGEAYAGAGNSLNTALSPSGWVRADVHNGAAPTAMMFGTGDYSFSYWSYDASNLDADIRGPRVFDSLSGTTTGIQLGSDGTGLFNHRIDDTAGNQVISNTAGLTINQPDGLWTHVVVNTSRTTNTAELFFDGLSQGTWSIAPLTGNVQPTQDLQIGVINANFGTGATTVGGAQQSGLDDLAFYSGTLSPTEIGLLASGVRPDQIPEPAAGVLGLFGALLLLRRRRA